MNEEQARFDVGIEVVHILNHYVYICSNMTRTVRSMAKCYKDSPKFKTTYDQLILHANTMDREYLSMKREFNLLCDRHEILQQHRIIASSLENKALEELRQLTKAFMNLRTWFARKMSNVQEIYLEASTLHAAGESVKYEGN